MGVLYFPLWTDAYLSDTNHLSTLEHGAYLLILMAMWRSGGKLPNDQTKLARIARLSDRRWRQISDTIMPLLQVEENVVTQKRLTQELKKTESIRKTRSEVGRMGARRAKQLKSLDGAQANADAIAPANDEQMGEQTESNRRASKPNIYTTTTVMGESQSEFDRISRACHGALPADATWRVKLSEDLSPILAAMHEGADLKLDVVPAIEASSKAALSAGKQITSWAYFGQSIRERHKSRKGAKGLKSKLDPAKLEERQHLAMRIWAKIVPDSNHFWSTDLLGPEPGSRGCKIPQHLFDEFGIEPDGFSPHWNDHKWTREYFRERFHRNETQPA